MKRLIFCVCCCISCFFMLQNLYAPDEDPRLKVVSYERSFEQKDDLGLNDMKTENYGEESAATCGAEETP